MSKSIKPAVVTVARFTLTEIAAAVDAVALPAALQGVEIFTGSKDVGGNAVAHLAAVNGKAQAIGLCQCFADFHFGSESRANLLKGIQKKMVRDAFDAATAEYLRIQGAPLRAETVLNFLKDFTSAAMTSARCTPEQLEKLNAPKDAEKPADKPADKPAASQADADAQIDADALQAAARQAEMIESQARTIAELQAALAVARETLSAVQSAKSIKDVRELFKAA